MKLKNLPWLLMIIGLVGMIFGVIGINEGYILISWFVAFIFYLSLSLGALFLIFMYHLFDSAWSTPLRRITEHVACLSFPLIFFFLPLVICFNLISQFLFYFSLATWAFFSNRLRKWSLKQDENGEPRCTYKMRRFAVWGILFYAITLTVMSHKWMNWGRPFQPLCGIQFLIAGAWASIALIYALSFILQKTGHLREVLREEQFYFLGRLFLAFTLFYGYVWYSQNLIVWNANVSGGNFQFSENQTIFAIGHFALPFLVLLRGDWKLNPKIILPLCAWVLTLHFLDIQFLILPDLSFSDVFDVKTIYMDLSCLFFIGGILSKIFLYWLAKYPAFPQRDPRMAEALGVHIPPTTHIATAPERSK